jgi:membrane fusion protein (multidrug efflux system)
MKLSALRALLPSTGMLLAIGCGGHAPPPPPAPPQVGTVTAKLGDVPLSRDLVGRLSPYFSANVVARVSGVLTKRLYKEGSEVKRGQVLFEIDPAYYQAAHDTNLANLAQDQATYTNDHVIAERNRKLLPIGSVSQQTVDDAEAADRSAGAKVKADQAAVAQSQINLGYTRIVSPIDGIAGQQQVTQGALVGSGTSDNGSGGTLLTTVQQVDPMYVNFTISAADLVTLRQSRNIALAGQSDTKVRVKLPNGTDYDKAGTLDFSDIAVNPTTGAVSLRALVPNPRHELLPGMYVMLQITMGKQNQVYLIPQQGVLRDTTGAYALVVGQDDKVVRKDVSANESYGNDWIVTGGLAQGDRVIVSGVQVAREGNAVKAVPWQAPAATDAPAAAAAPAAPAGT